MLKEPVEVQKEEPKKEVLKEEIKKQVLKEEPKKTGVVKEEPKKETKQEVKEESTGGLGGMGKKVMATLGVDADRLEKSINTGKFDMVSKIK
jgi:hypothetical protein